MMITSRSNTARHRLALSALVLLMFALVAQPPLFARKKKKKEAAVPVAQTKPQQDTSRLVWPGPPNIGRVKYVQYFAGQKFDLSVAPKKKPKQSWMDRLAGVQPSPTGKLKRMPFQLLGPYLMAVDADGNLYVPDQKVGAVFVFNTQTRSATLIRNGVEATFGWINGVAIDDDGRIFITDGKLHRVLILNKNRQVVDQIKGDLIDPVGIAIDTENRFVYVVDTQQDQVLVYDADSLKLLRRLGHTGKLHEMTALGDFAAPTGVALDADGNVYVTDTLNNRVEIFDADGEFISQFGRHCDGYGCFAHPKGIAIDSDGHIWVADPMLDLLQVFNRDGQLLAFVGGHGNLLGQFSSLVGVAFDPKSNLIFTSEQYPGRVQEFQYITDAQAAERKKEKEAQRLSRAEEQTAPPAAQGKAEDNDVKPQ
jgi:DNA-binding beta-propeller fold protein YncE